ncbi:MAG: TonB-dependent receptor, partial [Rubrivivax sp.]
RMRGLGNGYTQLLIDGQRMPPGFSLESLTPEQIERIEILRAPTAETGARAIAGTINIVTREGFRRRLNDVRLGFAYENGAWTPGGSWTHNDSAGLLTYNISASAFSNRRRSDNHNEVSDRALSDGSLLEAQHEDSRTQEERRGLNVTTRLQWRLSESGDMLVLMPSLFHSEGRSRREFELGQSVPPPPALPPYDSGDAASDSRFTNARLGANWRQRLGSGARLEFNGNAGGYRAVGSSLRSEYRNGGTLLRTLQDNSLVRERSANLTTKLSQTLGGSDAQPDSAHSLVGGLELETVRRNETRNGDSQADDSAGNLQASSLRIATYLQDEWSLTPNWALHAGLRWEGITTRGSADDGSEPRNRSSVTTPLLHLLWKPNLNQAGGGRDQVRLSLTRSYRAPSLATLIGRTTINSKFDPSGPNGPTSPDRAGNPGLKPELATGVDLAIERYLSGGGMLSANVFHRSISNLMRSVTQLETVSYSQVERYVARQQNVGDAVTQGIELEAKFPLDSAIAGAPRVELRSNLSLFRSRVKDVPGPDNRLDQQAKATGNIGADYRFRSPPLNALTIGGNLNWVPGYETQLSADQRTTTGSKRVFDAFALWNFDTSTALRLLASNLNARDYGSSNTIVTATSSESSRSFGPSYTNWQLRLELKL